jgi:hypothetical protein
MVDPCAGRWGRVIVGCAAAALVLGSSFVAGATSLTWTATSVPWTIPGPSIAGGFHSVSCATTTLCVALSTESPVTTVESFNGTVWTPDSVPIPNPGESMTLGSVSCSAATETCVAVGVATVVSATGVSSLASVVASYRGASWSTQLIAAPSGWSGLVLRSVSCTTTCVALGLLTNNTTDAEGTAAATLSGITWSVAVLDGINDVYPGELASISCVSATWCAAASGNDGGSVLLETFNGSGWAGSTLDLPGTLSATVASGGGSISCSAEESCLFTLNSSAGVVAITLSNGTWTATTSAAGANAGVSVSCAPGALLQCLSVGADDSSAGAAAAQDIAGTWTTSTIPTTTLPRTDLSAVSCVSATWCAAVGSDAPAPTYSVHPLAAIWTSSTSQLTTLVNFPGAPNAAPNSLSCTSSTACTGVGVGVTAADPDGAPIAIVLGRGGWRDQVDASTTPAAVVRVNAVSCAAASCVAVGRRASAPYVETSTGGAWTGVALRVPASASAGALNAVSCPSAGDCVSVGVMNSRTKPAVVSSFVEQRSRGTWKLTVLPNLDRTKQDELSSVSCATTASCVAVGAASWGTHHVAYVAVLRHGHWTTTLVAPTAGFASVSLTAVSCASPTACTATASDEESGAANSSTAGVATWNGTRWSAIDQLDVSNYPNLLSISCPTASTCVAVGDVSLDGSFVVTQSTSGWTTTEPLAPDGSGGKNPLLAVSCWASNACRAVGTYGVNGIASYQLN